MYLRQHGSFLNVLPSSTRVFLERSKGLGAAVLIGFGGQGIRTEVGVWSSVNVNGWGGREAV